MQPVEVAQRGVAGAEIIDAPLDADGAQTVHDRARGLDLADERTLGHFEREAGGVQRRAIRSAIRLSASPSATATTTSAAAGDGGMTWPSTRT